MEDRHYELLKTFLLFVCVGFIIGFSISSLIGTCSAAQTLNSSVNVTDITDTSITFEVKYKTTVRASGATFDGVEIVGFDLLHNVNYTAKDLQPDTQHTFCIYKDLINCETATTTSTKESIDYIYDFIWEFIFIIVIIICLFVAVHHPIVGFAAFVFSCLGLMQKLNDYILIDKLEFSTFIMGTVYFIFAIASLFIAFNKD